MLRLKGEIVMRNLVKLDGVAIRLALVDPVEFVHHLVSRCQICFPLPFSNIGPDVLSLVRISVDVRYVHNSVGLTNPESMP